MKSEGQGRKPVRGEGRERRIEVKEKENSIGRERRVRCGEAVEGEGRSKR